MNLLLHNILIILIENMLSIFNIALPYFVAYYAEFVHYILTLNMLEEIGIIFIIFYN